MEKIFHALQIVNLEWLRKLFSSFYKDIYLKFLDDLKKYFGIMFL